MNSAPVDQRWIRSITNRVAGQGGWQAIAYAASLAVLVAGPWLLPGYIFGTDWPGPRNLAFPAQVDSSSGLQAGLAIAGKLLSAELAGKILILSALFLAGFTAYRALPIGGFVPRAVAALVYLVNPFVYGRLNYGQVNLVAGYAILPWVASRIRKLLLEPGVNAALVAGFGLALLGVLDLHLMLLAGAFSASLLVIDVMAQWRTPRYLLRLAPNLLLSVAVCLIMSLYWLLPLLTASNAEGNVVKRISEADVSVFSSVADPKIGLLPNVLGLYGFWAENAHRFASMKVFVPFWPIALGLLLILAIVGAAATMASAPGLRFHGARVWVAGLLLAGIVAVTLEIGVADPHVAPLVRWLDRVFPLYRGMRDSGKWATLLALVYSQLVPLGIVALVDWSSRIRATTFREVLSGLVIGLGLALPLYYGNGLLFGMHGQIRPSQYPGGWYAGDRILAADPHPGRAVFLPWHLYLGLSFVRNANSVVASPAPSFFSIPVVISADPEYPRIPYPRDADQRTISELMAAGPQAPWAARLAERNIKYVILAREVDWRLYGFLDDQIGLVKVGDFGSLVVYRNTLWSANPKMGLTKPSLRVEPDLMMRAIVTRIDSGPIRV